MKQKLVKVVKKLISALLGVVMGAAMGMAVAPLVIGQFGSSSILVVEIVMLTVALVTGVLAFMLLTIVHEAGHLLAGLASGYSFVSFRVGGLMLIRLNGRLHWKRFSLAGTAGQCLMKPPAWSEKGIPVQLYNWGGVLANLAVALLLIPAVCLLPGDGLPGMLTRVLLVMTLFQALTNGLPIGSNDGYNALHLKHDLLTQRAFWQQMTANALLAEGVPVRDMPPELFELPEGANLSNPLIASTAVTAAQLPLIRHDFAAAHQQIPALLDDPDAKLHPIHRFQLQNDLLWLELMDRSQPETLEKIRTKQHMSYRKAMRRMPGVVRTVYTEALANGDAKAAADQLALMDKLAKEYPYQQDLADERALMELAQARLSGQS